MITRRKKNLPCCIRRIGTFYFSLCSCYPPRQGDCSSAPKRTAPGPPWWSRPGSNPDEPRITARMGIIIDNGPMRNSVTISTMVLTARLPTRPGGNHPSIFILRSRTAWRRRPTTGPISMFPFWACPRRTILFFTDPTVTVLSGNAVSYRSGPLRPRTRFVEILFIDDDYRGLYVLTEKLKRDRNRVDMASLASSEDTSDLEISGGYILRIDKTTGMGVRQQTGNQLSKPWFRAMDG